MNEGLDRRVRRRARDRCEYCRLPQSAWPFRHQIDHIISRQNGGEAVAESLALACIACNLHKGPNIAGLDPETGELARLFHPRQDRWSDHFARRGAEIVGRSPIGRVTVRILAINAPAALAIREALIAERSRGRRP